jgi:hypothetical protein
MPVKQLTLFEAELKGQEVEEGEGTGSLELLQPILHLLTPLRRNVVDPQLSGKMEVRSSHFLSCPLDERE